MNEILHQELIGLQKSLSNIESARTQLETIKTVAKQVVESVQFIQQQYETHLTNLLNQLTNYNQEQFASLQAENSSIMSKTAENLIRENTQIAVKYQEQYQQIQGYLAQYESVIKITDNLAKTISTVDFPQRLEKLETVVVNIHAEVKKDVAELIEVKKNNDEHLTAVQEAHQYYLSNFYQTTDTQFNEIAEKSRLQTDKIIHDFRTLQEETEVIFNQQKQNFHLTLQQVESQTQKSLLNVANNTNKSLAQIEHQTQKVLESVTQTAEILVQKVSNVIAEMQAGFIRQQLDLQKFMASYQGLLDYTKVIENKIVEINFPQKLDNLLIQITNLETKTDSNYTDFKNISTKHFTEIETKILHHKKQQDNQYQLLENQQLMMQTKMEQKHQQSQNHLNELHKTQVDEIKVQADFLQKQLVIQNKMLQYLLIAIVSVGLFSAIQLIWSVFKG